MTRCLQSEADQRLSLRFLRRPLPRRGFALSVSVASRRGERDRKHEPNSIKGLPCRLPSDTCEAKPYQLAALAASLSARLPVYTCICLHACTFDVSQTTGYC